VARRCGGWSVAPIDECDTWDKVVICLGDYQAVKSGGIGKRVANKLIGRGVVRRLGASGVMLPFRPVEQDTEEVAGVDDVARLHERFDVVDLDRSHQPVTVAPAGRVTRVCLGWSEA
jgi:hypothetical protein